MKKYLLSLLITTILGSASGYADNPITEFEATVENAKYEIEKSMLSSGVKEEIQALFNIFLEKIQKAQETGEKANIIQQRDQTLAERKTQLEEQYPNIFQKIVEWDDANQWFVNCISLIVEVTSKLQDEKLNVWKKMVKLMRRVNEKSDLPVTFKQEREKFLNIFEYQLDQNGQNLDIVEQATQTLQQIRSQQATENPIFGDKITEFADAMGIFVQFANNIYQQSQAQAQAQAQA